MGITDYVLNQFCLLPVAVTPVSYVSVIETSSIIKSKVHYTQLKMLVLLLLNMFYFIHCNDDSRSREDTGHTGR